MPSTEAQSDVSMQKESAVDSKLTVNDNDSVTNLKDELGPANIPYMGPYTKLEKVQITPPTDPLDPTFPQDGDLVKVHYTGTIASTGVKFDSSRDRNRLFEFTLGQGQVIEGWDEGFKLLQQGERAVLKIPSEMAYGSSAPPGSSIPADSDLNFDVELVSFGAKPKDKFEMSDEELIEEATNCKEKGNELFKQAKYTEAMEAYEQICEYLGDQYSWEGSKAENRDTVLLSAHLNSSQCFMKLGDFKAGSTSAFKALELSEFRNEKALYRYTSCCLKMHEFDTSQFYIKKWLELNPRSKEARALFAEFQACWKKHRLKEKNLAGKMICKSMYSEKKSVAMVIPKVIDECDKVYMDVKFTKPTSDAVTEGEEEVTDDMKEETGRITMALYQKQLPKTTENFKQLCTGENEKSYTFKNSIFHRVIPGFMMQGGDFTNHNGTGGMSIYGEKFADENLDNESNHDKKYLLSMANAGPNTNGSQFFITFKETPHLNGKHVVFGEVIDGFEWVQKAEQWKIGEGDVPVGKIEVVECGVVVEGEKKE